MSDQGGIDYNEAWLVTTGWSHDPVMIFPDEDSAKAASKLMSGSNLRVVKLKDHLSNIKKDIKKKILTKLDREWAQARDQVTWEE